MRRKSIRAVSLCNMEDGSQNLYWFQNSYTEPEVRTININQRMIRSPSFPEGLVLSVKSISTSIQIWRHVRIEKLKLTKMRMLLTNHVYLNETRTMRLRGRYGIHVRLKDIRLLRKNCLIINMTDMGQQDIATMGSSRAARRSKVPVWANINNSEMCWDH